MIRFAHIEYLYALAVLVPVIALYYYGKWSRRRSMERFGNPVLLEGLVRTAGKHKRAIRFGMTAAALFLLIVGLANPRVGTKMEEVKREGVDVMIALDVSNSMMAEDIRPNRLEHAKQNISRMLDRLQNDRVGLIVFAGESYLQLPLTTDYGAVRLVLHTVDTDAVPVPGTAIGSAIRLAMANFAEGEKKHKVILLVTDGENHEDDAVEEAEKAGEEGVVIHAIGMGSPDGSPLPVYRNGVPAGFRKDRNGNVVISRLAESTLQGVAEAGGGVYIRATNRQNDFDDIFDRIESMEKKEFGARVFTEYEDRFQYFLGPALLLLFAGFFLSEQRTSWKFPVKLFGGKFLTILVPLLFLTCGSAVAQEGRSLVREGNSLYKHEKYPDAEVNYRKALESAGDHSLSGKFNLGDALYRQGRYDEAVEQFQNAAGSTDDDRIRAQALHNIGNARLKGGRLDESIQAYESALRLNPGDDDTRYNLEYAKRLLHQQQRQQEKQKEGEKNREQKKDGKDDQQGDRKKKQEQQQKGDDQKKERQRPGTQSQPSDKTGTRDNRKQDQNREGERRKDRISRADAERILEALKNQEQEVMKKLQKKVPARVNVEKDW